MPNDHHEDAVTESHQFDKKVDDFTWGGRQNRVVTRWVVLLTVVIALVVAVVWYDSAQQHSITQSQEKQTCTSGNKVRFEEQQLWTYVFSALEPTHPTIKQQNSFAEINAQMHKDLKLRDCISLYG